MLNEKEISTCTLTPEDIKRVKGMGFLQHAGTNKFNARVITRNGRITTDEAAAIAEAAKLYGDGHMMMTTRLTIEVSGIDYENIPAFQAELAKAGLYTGGTGTKVRPIVSCKGTTCQYGLLDSYGLTNKIHEKFYIGYHGVPLPHKFKICVGGCPNNCAKPGLNDLGVMGQRVPTVDPEKCRGCKKCQVAAACPMKAASVVDGKVQMSASCNNCGRCMGKCLFGAVSYQDGYRITIGGRFGKKCDFGRPLTRLFLSEEEVLTAIEKAICLFRDEGTPGERFADTIARLGFDCVNEKLTSW